MNKERLEEIVEKIAEQLYDRIVVPETKVIIEYQYIKYLFNTIEEQSEQLYGTKHKYGYKDMYGKCNADYASLNSEKEELSRQNKRYREELDILGEVINSAPNADKL